MKTVRPTSVAKVKIYICDDYNGKNWKAGSTVDTYFDLFYKQNLLYKFARNYVWNYLYVCSFYFFRVCIDEGVQIVVAFI